MNVFVCFVFEVAERSSQEQSHVETVGYLATVSWTSLPEAIYHHCMPILPVADNLFLNQQTKDKSAT